MEKIVIKWSESYCYEWVYNYLDITVLVAGLEIICKKRQIFVEDFCNLITTYSHHEYCLTSIFKSNISHNEFSNFSAIRRGNMESTSTLTRTLPFQITVNRFHEQSLSSKHWRGFGDRLFRCHKSGLDGVIW